MEFIYDLHSDSKAGRRTVCKRFSSDVVSTIPPGVTIIDTLFKLDSEHNTIRVDIGFPYFLDGEDPRNNSEIFSFLEKKGLLE